MARDVERFRRRLQRLRLRPADVGAAIGANRGIGWAAGKLYLLAPLALAFALVGFIAFYPPYRVTGWIVGRVRLKPDERSTWKLLIGIGVYALWTVVVAVAAGGVGGGMIRGLVVAVAVLLGMPAIGMLGLVVRERWRGAWEDARRFLLLRSRRDLVARLHAERHALGVRLDALLARSTVAPQPAGEANGPRGPR